MIKNTIIIFGDIISAEKVKAYKRAIFQSLFTLPRYRTRLTEALRSHAPINDLSLHIR